MNVHRHPAEPADPDGLLVEYRRLRALVGELRRELAERDVELAHERRQILHLESKIGRRWWRF